MATLASSGVGALRKRLIAFRGGSRRVRKNSLSDCSTLGVNGCPLRERQMADASCQSRPARSPVVFQELVIGETLLAVDVRRDHGTVFQREAFW
jgi:hypothetical protein